MNWVSFVPLFFAIIVSWPLWTPDHDEYFGLAMVTTFLACLFSLLSCPEHPNLRHLSQRNLVNQQPPQCQPTAITMSTLDFAIAHPLLLWQRIAFGPIPRFTTPYETLPGVTETPGNGVFFSGETPPDTARYTPIWQPQVLLCSMPVLVVNRPL
jgi:hypothetical protein